MKQLSALVIALLFVPFGFAQEHHPKHNMVLFGEQEMFASHIVYKPPHHYQVILKVNFDPGVREAIDAEKRGSPQNRMIYLLDESDISQISGAESISGTVFSEDVEGKQRLILSQVRLKRGEFKVLYFSELEFLR